MFFANGENILPGTKGEKVGGLSVMGFCRREKSRLTKKKENREKRKNKRKT